MSKRSLPEDCELPPSKKKNPNEEDKKNVVEDKTIQLLMQGSSNYWMNPNGPIKNKNITCCAVCDSKESLRATCTYCDTLLCNNCRFWCCTCKESFCKNCSFPIKFCSDDHVTAICYDCFCRR